MTHLVNFLVVDHVLKLRSNPSRVCWVAERILETNEKSSWQIDAGENNFRWSGLIVVLLVIIVATVPHLEFVGMHDLSIVRNILNRSLLWEPIGCNFSPFSVLILRLSSYFKNFILNTRPRENWRGNNVFKLIFAGFRENCVDMVEIQNAINW